MADSIAPERVHRLDISSHSQRHVVWNGLVAVLVIVLSAQGVLAERACGRPNILVLVTDDQRWDALGCMGNAIIETPHMDQLAADGTLFANAFVTSSVCAASRASILTGLYERTHRCNFNTGPLRKALLEQSYPMLLRRAGYLTGFIGKYGVGDSPKREIDGEDVFDRWYGFYGQGRYFPEETNGKHLTQIMLDQAKEFLDQTSRDQPFCLSISFKAPHSGDGYLGLTPDPALRDKYRDAAIPMPSTAQQTLFDALPEFLQRCNARTNYWQLRYSEPKQFQAVMKDYYRLITGVDVVLGQLRSELSRRGLAANTVILFLSDNGEMTGDYMLGGKELLYDASIRVPMIVYDPRVPTSARGQRRTEMALNIDIAPTVLDYADQPIPRTMQGCSLATIVRGERNAWRDRFFCENNLRVRSQYYPMIEGLRTERWKYVR